MEESNPYWVVLVKHTTTTPWVNQDSIPEVGLFRFSVIKCRQCRNQWHLRGIWVFKHRRGRITCPIKIRLVFMTFTTGNWRMINWIYIPAVFHREATLDFPTYAEDLELVVIKGFAFFFNLHQISDILTDIRPLTRVNTHSVRNDILITYFKLWCFYQMRFRPFFKEERRELLRVFIWVNVFACREVNFRRPRGEQMDIVDELDLKLSIFHLFIRRDRWFLEEPNRVVFCI